MILKRKFGSLKYMLNNGALRCSTISARKDNASKAHKPLYGYQTLFVRIRAYYELISAQLLPINSEKSFQYFILFRFNFMAEIQRIFTTKNSPLTILSERCFIKSVIARNLYIIFGKRIYDHSSFRLALNLVRFQILISIPYQFER